jgi:hypothetical protein
MIRVAHLPVVITVVAPLILAGSAAGPGALLAQARPGDAACVRCHLEQEEESLVRPVVRFEEDVHRAAGLGCLDCHGLGHEGGEDPASGLAFLSKPSAEEVVRFCGSCHSDAAYMRQFNPSLRVDQLQEYRTSVHGRLLLEEGDTTVATCVDCHPAHEILPPSDPESSVYPQRVADLCASCHADPALMEPRGHETDESDDYREGVHGQLMYEEGDISAPTCNDCHGNHGAAPPGVSSVGNVCGECHTTMAEFFEQSAHEEWFEAEGLAGCAACHGNHDISPPDETTIGLRFDDVCTQCHDPRDPVALEFTAMAVFLTELQEEHELSLAALEEAENAGMEVSTALFELDEVSTVLIRARSAIHSFNYHTVEEVLEPGLEITEAAAQRAEEAMEEHRFRRVGLGVFAGIVLSLVLTLLLKIRQLEGVPSRSDGTIPADKGAHS